LSTLRRSYRWWHARSTVVLSAAMLAVVGLGAAQALRWRESPAIYAVALLVTAQIALVLGYLLVRHLRRQAPRESPIAALLGVAAAAVITIGAPRLDLRPMLERGTSVIVGTFGSEGAPPAPEVASVPAERVRAPELPAPPAEPAPPPPEPPAAELETPRQEAPAAAPEPVDETPERPEMRTYRKLQEDPPWSRDRQAERESLEEALRHGLPSATDPAALPGVHAGASLYLAHMRGSIGLGRGGDADIDPLLGSETFETGAELLAEFPLSPRQVLRVSFIGLRTGDEGTLGHDLDLGGVTLPEGTPYEFDMTWGHVFVGFSHRFAGYTRESTFDFSAHLGVMIDHLSAELKTPVFDGEVDGRDEGWAAVAVGFSVGLWDLGRGGLVVEVLQSVPVNIGGQTIALTDLRLVYQYDLTSHISLVLGYRRVFAAFRTFEEAVTYEGKRTASKFDLGGPVVGLDIRF